MKLPTIAPYAAQGAAAIIPTTRAAVPCVHSESTSTTAIARRPDAVPTKILSLSNAIAIRAIELRRAESGSTATGPAIGLAFGKHPARRSESKPRVDGDIVVSHRDLKLRTVDEISRVRDVLPPLRCAALENAVKDRSSDQGGNEGRNSSDCRPQNKREIPAMPSSRRDRKRVDHCR
jgi:hypothetical protein